MNGPRSIIRAVLIALLCLAIMATVAFLVVVDIIDGVSRDEDSWARAGEPIVQEIPSVKESRGD